MTTNWYITAKKAKSDLTAIDGTLATNFIFGGDLDKGEKILGAAVLASGRIFFGANHAFAMMSAISAGAGVDDGAFMGFDSTDGTVANIDLFITNKMRIIDRMQAYKETGIAASEDISRQHPSRGRQHAVASSGIDKRAMALQGEWWIIDGQAIFADGDIGDFNHDAYVINHIQQKYAPDEFCHEEWVDWDGFKKSLLEEAAEEKYGDESFAKAFSSEDSRRIIDEKLTELGMDREEILIADNEGDPRKYGMAELGWKRMHGNNIQTQFLRPDDIKDIANGINDAYGDIEEEQSLIFNIEVNSTRTIFEEVPFKIISKGDYYDIKSFARDY
jgi:hypothetical protein